ncbi:DNA-binding protein [Geobacillus sp. Manikaran-105]|uniref:DNA-binding protein n=1 Tax=Geobacillus sp. Manikaran-105 TaxID=2055940 RepID=UPI000B925E1F|nr:DNA-binding protein [Geobacillus sp. Manikaran-105]ASS88628.1 DNA-binding protein [Geobacillus lituanicus]PJW13971.1 DNA-binding protein [Geobacillus sp. Manikaran-105]
MSYHFASRKELEDFIKSEVLGVAETLEILNVTYQRLSKLIESGRIVPIKSFQKDKLFFRDDVETLAKELKELRKKYRPYDAE